MKSITIKNTVLGEGMPKVCAPLVGTSPKALLEEAAVFTSLPIDIAEWRADWFGPIMDPDFPGQILPQLNTALGGLPLLFTFRTHGEGGNLPASISAYRALAEKAVSSRQIDLVDVELFTGDEIVKDLVNLAHRHQVKVILSNHDFNSTPDEEELIGRLTRMEELGADIAKIAVTPQTPEDVLALLSATRKASARLSCPVITMSMKGTGLISRLSGELFGSCLTFGSVKQASAPGQIDVCRLKDILSVIHDSL